MTSEGRVSSYVCPKCGNPNAFDQHDQHCPGEPGRSRSPRLRPHRVGYWWLCLRCWLNKDERREARQVNTPARKMSDPGGVLGTINHQETTT